MLNNTDQIIRHKAGLLNLAEELGPKARQCAEGLSELFAKKWVPVFCEKFQ